MKVRKGFTLIELLVVVAIIAILGLLISSATGTSIFGKPRTVEAQVTDKWTDIDGDGTKIYRIRTTSSTGEVDTWNSYYCHDDLQVGVSYRLNVSGSYVKNANRLAIQ